MSINRLPSLPPRSPLAAPDADGPSTRQGAPSAAPHRDALSGLSALRRGMLGTSASKEARAAARTGDTTKLVTLLQARPDLITRLDSHGDNLLGIAARAGNTESVRAVLHHAAFHPGGAVALLNHQTPKGETPLAIAVAASHATAVEALLREPHVDVNLANAKGETPLHLAVVQGNATVAGRLLAHTQIDPGRTDANGDTALHTAVNQKNPELVELLTRCPANVVNKTDAKGRTALELALQGGDIHVASKLLKHPDIDVNARNARAESVLFQAAVTGNAPFVELLLNDPRVHPGLADANGHTPLHLLARYGFAADKLAIIRMLASHPRAANEVNRQGFTPLEVAIEHHRHAALQALIAGDAIDLVRPSTRNQRSPVQQVLHRLGQTAYADQQHNLKEFDRDRLIDTLQLLARSDKLDLNAPLPNGHTLLTGLCSIHPRATDIPLHRQFVQETVRKTLAGIVAAAGDRVDLNQVNRGNRTPLQQAARGSDPLLVQQLLDDKRTDPNVMANWLVQDPYQAYRMLTSSSAVPTQTHLEFFVAHTLASWADRRTPEGRHHPGAALSNAALGQWLAEHGRAAGSMPPADACSKGEMFHLALALEQSLNAKEFGDLPQQAKLLLQHAPGVSHFNLQGVDVSRNEVENWSAGVLPDAFINRRIDEVVGRFGVQTLLHPEQVNLNNVTENGMIMRGRQILANIHAQLNAGQLMSLPQCVDEVKVAMDAVVPPAEGPKSLAEAGLDYALSLRDQYARTELGTDSRQALVAMWSYIQTRESPLREDLTNALLRSLKDIGEERPCDSGCVERILFAADGVDVSLTGTEPGPESIRSEINALAGMVNNRFEELYGHGTAAPDAGTDGPSSTSATPLTPQERELVARYRGAGAIDERILLEIKQDMLEATAMTDLVGRRGWRTSAVKPELEAVKESMQYL